MPSLSNTANGLMSTIGAASASAMSASKPAGLELTIKLLAATTATDSGLVTARFLPSSNTPVIRLRVYTITASFAFSAT